jgi:hypothetical protein
MTIFEDCICIAQARIIEGNNTKAHVCTIAFHEKTNSFIRTCLPFDGTSRSSIRRWSRFSFDGSSSDKDTRNESYRFDKLLKISDKIKDDKTKREIHRKILQKYKHEEELNAAKESVGVLTFEKETLRFKRKDLSAREESYRQLMQKKGLFFPEFKLYVSGKSPQFKGRFEKQLVQWDFFEAYRQGRDPVEIFFQQYREPYIILGNTPWHRDSFMAVSFLSAPKGFIQYAKNQQLSLV